MTRMLLLADARTSLSLRSDSGGDVQENYEL
jgi:hypothetical protein